MVHFPRTAASRHELTAVVHGPHHSEERLGERVLDRVRQVFCALHGHDNLYVMDASTHVTNGGFNPVLTIMALAFRNAAKLAAELRTG